jgi:hypothetical protein
MLNHVVGVQLVAEHKDYGLSGVNRNLQLGKQGPQLKNNGDGTFSVTDVSGTNLTNVEGANATQSNQFVTKAQLDALASGQGTDGFNLVLGNISSAGDASWTDGAVQTITNSTSVSESIDQLNEAIENVRNNTFVKSVDFTVDVDSGGAPLTSTLSITTVGNANRYTIDWGDGNVTTSTSDSTPTHTYNNNTDSPFDVSVTAFNNAGSGTGSTASEQKADFITLYTGDPVVNFGLFANATGGSAISISDYNDTIYIDNNTTNTTGATIQYTVDWGDGSNTQTVSSDTASGGAHSSASRLSHQFSATAEQDEEFTVELSLDSHSTAAPGIVPTSKSITHKVYAEHTPSFTQNANTGINESTTNGLPITITNTTENTIGSFADFGIQYRYVWGDGDTSTVNVGTNAAGDTARSIQHTYELSASDQANGTARDYTGNLEVISNHGSSPFRSVDFTVHVEPDVRADFSAISTTSDLRASGDAKTTLYKGTDLSGNNRAVLTLDNTTQNGDFYNIDWGDTTSSGQINEAGAPAGSVAGANITHDYGSATAGNKSLVFAASGTPDITAQTDSQTLTIKVEDVPAAPAGVSTKSLTLATSSNQGSTTKLASGAVDTISSGLSAGAGLNTSTVRRYDSTTVVATNNITDAYASSTGNTASAKIDDTVNGQIAFTNATSETGTFGSLLVTAEGDAHAHISSSTYPENFYHVFSAKVSTNISSMDHGVHSLHISHDNTGDTNKVFVVRDNLTSTPTVDISGATLQEESAGSYRYVSGIPYYNSGSPSVKLVGATVSNLTGQAYYDASAILHIADGASHEGQTGLGIIEGSRSYSQIDGAVSMLSSGIPLANVGISTPYELGNISISITNSNLKAVETVKIAAQNMNGMSGYSGDTTEKIQVWKQTPIFDETAIPVSDSLGATFDDDGKRITGFSGASDTPTIASATDFYSNNAWSGAQTIAGTAEAVLRFDVLKHFDTDLSSEYLPIGPDLSTGRSGAQYFTFAFRRTTMSNFDITFSGKVSGMFVAAPGTDIDNASTLDGWLDASTTYGGAGTPGADTSNGGNGSNGCAFTSGDRIVDGVNYNNQTFTITLGDQNATNSTGNNILVRIKLEDGDSISALSIS